MFTYGVVYGYLSFAGANGISAKPDTLAIAIITLFGDTAICVVFTADYGIARAALVVGNQRLTRRARSLRKWLSQF